jgi:hypothetical protein
VPNNYRRGVVAVSSLWRILVRMEQTLFEKPMVVTAMTSSESVAWRIPRENPTARMERKLIMYSTLIAESNY